MFRVQSFKDVRRLVQVDNPRTKPCCWNNTCYSLNKQHTNTGVVPIRKSCLIDLKHTRHKNDFCSCTRKQVHGKLSISKWYLYLNGKINQNTANARYILSVNRNFPAKNLKWSITVSPEITTCAHAALNAQKVINLRLRKLTTLTEYRTRYIVPRWFLPCDALRCTVFVIVILSICLSVCNTRGLCPHASTYDHDFFTVW